MKPTKSGLWGIAAVPDIRKQCRVLAEHFAVQIDTARTAATFRQRIFEAAPSCRCNYSVIPAFRGEAPARQSDQNGGGAMAVVRWLAVLPFLGILGGVPFLNHVEPMVLGMPLLLAWVVLWIVLTSVVMAIVYLCDPANRDAS